MDIQWTGEHGSHPILKRLSSQLCTQDMDRGTGTKAQNDRVRKKKQRGLRGLRKRRRKERHRSREMETETRRERTAMRQWVWGTDNPTEGQHSLCLLTRLAVELCSGLFLKTNPSLSGVWLHPKTTLKHLQPRSPGVAACYILESSSIYPHLPLKSPPWPGRLSQNPSLPQGNKP